MNDAVILLAEDDAEMREMIAATLRSDGYEVIVARNGAELVARLSEGFDLLLSDVRMPACSGLFVLEGLRRARSNVPVILMTAFGDEATRARVEASDAILFDKPFDIDDLRTAVLHLLTPHSSPSDVSDQRARRR